MNSDQGDTLVATSPPGRWPPWSTLVRFAVRQTLRSRRAVLVYLLLALPPVVGIITVHAADISDARTSAQIYWGLTLAMMLTASLPLAAMLSCGPLVSNEVSDGTLVYLLTRRLSRQSVLLAKFLGAVFSLVAVSVLSQALLVVTFAFGRYGLTGAERGAALVGGFAIVAVGAVVFAAVFNVISMIFRKPLAVGVGFLIVTEWIFLTLPVGIRRLTVGYHLRSLLNGITDSPILRSMLAERAGDGLWSAGASGGILVAIVAGALTTSAIIMMWREFTQAREEER